MQSIEPLEIALSLSEVGIAMLKHLGIHQGRYQVAVGFRLGLGGVPGEKDGAVLPGAMVGVENVALLPVEDSFQGPNVLNAAQVNPSPKTAAKKAPAKSRTANR